MSSSDKDEECCNMKGMLSFLIIFILSKKNMHGQQIAIELQKRRGEKPSPGTLYPALKNLKKDLFIKEESSGKLIIYSLTPKGKRVLKVATRRFCQTFKDVF